MQATGLRLATEIGHTISCVARRFTGRGIMYLFLGTLVFIVLFDDNVNPTLGFIFGFYVMIVGLICGYQGLSKSLTLDKVRRGIKDQNIHVDSFCPENGLPVREFGQLAKKVASTVYSFYRSLLLYCLL